MVDSLNVLDRRQYSSLHLGERLDAEVKLLDTVTLGSLDFLDDEARSRFYLEVSVDGTLHH